jgi:hypothetical protein
MKKILILVICTILAGKTFSQEYYPLVVEDNTWNVMAAGIYPNFDTAYSTVTYMLSGDSVINSITYKRLYFSFEEIPVNWGLYGFMREDETKKVWLKTEFATQEFLMYDFSVAIGDTVFVGQQEPVGLVVDSITTVTVNGTERQKFWFSWPDNPYYTETWTVGIGSSKGIVWSGSAMIVGGFYELLCMSNNGEQIYMNPDYDFCYINTVKVDENNMEAFQIYPIPVVSNLIISNLINIEIQSISIIDFSGRKIQDFEAGSSLLDLSVLKPGVYFLKISTENGPFLTKIIKN